MELLTPTEYFAFDVILGLAGAVHYRELVAPGEDLFFDVEFHEKHLSIFLSLRGAKRRGNPVRLPKSAGDCHTSLAPAGAVQASNRPKGGS